MANINEQETTDKVGEKQPDTKFIKDFSAFIFLYERKDKND